MNASSDLHWASSSAQSLFGESHYMENEDAIKYIIGEESRDFNVDASTSWDNLASYMMTVQRTIDQQDNEEVYQDYEKKLDEDNDELSVVSETNEVSKSERNQEKKSWSKRKLFKKALSGKKIHLSY